MPLVTLWQYSKMRGESYNTIKYAAKMGRIKTEKKGGKVYVDPVEANKQWDEQTELSKSRPGRPRKEKAEGENKPVELPPEVSKLFGVDIKELSFAKARTLKEAYSAELARLKVEQLQGLLVLAEDVKREAFKNGRIIREAILNIPSRLSTALADLKDPIEIQLFLERELKKILAEVTTDVERAEDLQDGDGGGIETGSNIDSKPMVG